MSKVWYSKKWLAFLLHAAAWILLFSLPYLLSSTYSSNKPQPDNDAKENARLWYSMIMDITWVVFFYINAYILIPRLMYRKKYWQYVALQFLILAWVLVQGAILFRLFMDTEHFKLGRHITFSLFVYLLILSASTAYEMTRDRLRADKLAKEKENENLKTELSLLRSQVSPHFMFNVLNNMVSLARKKSDILEPSLIKLSSLMRYMLYETNEEKVSLEKEIDYLHSYIDLQQQRFGKKLTVNVSIDAVDGRYQIEPMLLIPFVENAFKHGTGLIEDAIIEINLTAQNNILKFTVRNKYDPLSKDIKDTSSGIGLNNVMRRLNLLYTNEHTLMITKENNWFVVSLQIKIN